MKKENTIKKKVLEHWVVVAVYLCIYDVVAVNFSYFFGLWLRFDLKFSGIPTEFYRAFIKFAPFYTIFCIVVFYLLHLYKSIWRFASFNELNRLFLATLITSVFHIAGISIFIRRMPYSYYIIGTIMQFILLVAVRFGYRYITLQRVRRIQNEKPVKNTMIIGAGAAGQTIIREMSNSTEIDNKPCCLIDDNPNKWGRYMQGVPVVGGRDSIMEAVKKYNISEIMFAIPTATHEVRRDILSICKETNCQLKSLPGLYQLTNGQISLSKMKPVAVEDLLGRAPIKVNMDEIFQCLKGKNIMVTGGGGIYRKRAVQADRRP